MAEGGAAIYYYAAAAAAAGYGASEQRAARKDQRKADKKQSRIASVENARRSRQNYAELRRRRAQVIAMSEAGGVSGGSATQGALGGMTSTFASNESFSQGVQTLDRGRFNLMSRANRRMGRASTANQLASFATGIGSYLENN